MELRTLAWVEKYRPTTVKNVIGPFKEKIAQYILSPATIPHLLFYSKAPGTGKTTLAKAIINDIGCDSLLLNASDDRKIEVIREKVKDFVITQSTNGLRKCVFLDEVDGMLKDPQNALRNLMETYSSNAFFILTCNTLEKIIDPIQNRCVVIEFTKHERTHIHKYLADICTNEGLKYTDEGLTFLVDYYYPSIRAPVNILQDIKTSNKSVTIETVSPLVNKATNIMKMLEEKKFNDIRKYILEEGIDCEYINKQLFDLIFDKNLPLKNVFAFTTTVAQNERDFRIGADPQIIFITSIPKLIQALVINE